MKFIWKGLFCGVALAGISACDILGLDDGELTDVTVPFCQLGYPPRWIAIQSSGAQWRFLTVTGTSITFQASEKLGFAFGGGSDSYVYYVTSRELSEVDCVYFGEPAPISVNASVEDVAEGEWFRVQARGLAFVGGYQDSSFSLRLPPAAEDVHAWLFRRPSTTAFGSPLRAIARHSIQPNEGMTLPPFDFASAEAVPFDSARITVGNVGEGSAFTFNYFEPPGFTMGIASDVQPLPWHFAVPAALLGPDDFHGYEILGDNRSLSYFYRRARDTTVVMGPELTQPSATVIGQSPCLRLRVTLQSQAEYASFVSIRFGAQYGSRDFRSNTVTVSRNYLGTTPDVWDISMPELQPAFDDGCLLSPNPASGWSVTAEANEGRVALALGGKGLDGEVRRLARGFAGP